MNDSAGRPEPPVDGDEVATLLGFLDFQRATFAWKCSDLDADGLSVTVGASSLTSRWRWILVHKIEEYARHNGHCDLLRQAVDGAVGE